MWSVREVSARGLIAALMLWFSGLAGCAGAPAGAASPDWSTQVEPPRRQALGEVSFITPCRSLAAIAIAGSGSEEAEGEREPLRFYLLDAQVRESARGIEKGDAVKIEYVFSPDTQRYYLEKIERVEGTAAPSERP